jgi:sulfur transfer protein SufE
LAVLIAAAVAVSFFASASSAHGAAPRGRREAVATDLSSRCKGAREKFSAWVNSEKLADDADSKAADQLTSIDPNLEPGDALTAGINQYNALHQAAQQLQATADQALAAAKKAVKGCRQSSMPKRCRTEFRTFTSLLSNSAASTGVHANEAQAAADINQAQLSGNTDAFNAAVDRYNALIEQGNQLVDDYNNNLRPAYDSAHSKCTKAAST